MCEIIPATDVLALQELAAGLSSRTGDIDVFIPAGMFLITEEIVFTPSPLSNWTIRGSGQDATVFSCEDPSVNAMRFVLKEGASLTVDGLQIASCASAIKVEVETGEGTGTSIMLSHALFVGNSAPFGAVNINSNGTVVTVTAHGLGK